MNSSVCDDEAGRIRPAFYIFFRVPAKYLE